MKNYLSSSVLLAVSALALAACGFKPMYGERATPTAESSAGHSVAANLSQIEILAIPDKSGQMLRNHLIDRFYKSGYPSNPAYILKVDKVEETRTELDLTKSSDATRAQLRMRAVMNLLDKNGKSILSRKVQSVTSFNILGSEFATHVTEDAARESAINDLARQIELNLSLYYNSQSQ